MRRFPRMSTRFCRQFLMTAQGDVKVGQFGTWFDLDKSGHVRQTIVGRIKALWIVRGVKLAIVKPYRDHPGTTICIDPDTLKFTSNRGHV